jgi:hypothetical protein
MQARLERILADHENGGSKSDAYLEILKALLDKVSQIDDHQQELARKVERFAAAFPGEDPEGHRRYHESVIEWRELRNQMVGAALKKVAEAGALAGTCWLIYAIWQAFMMELRK